VSDEEMSDAVRLFKMLEFKTVFKNTDEVIFIDNARTHSAKKTIKRFFSKSREKIARI
jgi:hypothetical protein